MAVNLSTQQLQNGVGRVTTPFYEIAGCKKQITKGKHRKLKVGDGQCNLAPSNEKDWKEIYFFPRVSKKYMCFVINTNVIIQI